jgi:hypothetical protein
MTLIVEKEDLTRFKASFLSLCALCLTDYFKPVHDGRLLFFFLLLFFLLLALFAFLLFSRLFFFLFFSIISDLFNSDNSAQF